jgi:hypothetical protein
MGTTITVLTPVPESRQAAAAGRPLPPSLQGKRVGFLDNTKANFGELARQFGDVLMKRYGAASVTVRRKANAATPAAPEIIEALAKECDVVFTGSGD